MKEPLTGEGIVLLSDVNRGDISTLLAPFGLTLVETPKGEAIPGSYWGESEAGLVGVEIHARADTPVHSLLHETSHYVCMTPSRRAHLLRDAGGDDLEEVAVCYHQILLARYIPRLGQECMFHDMDLWGYSFRKGSTRAWFEEDSEDARKWLFDHGLVDEESQLLFRLRLDEC